VPSGSRRFGWVDDWKAVDRSLSAMHSPVFSVAARPIKGTGEGKTVLLWEAEIAVTGKISIHNQTIGDCVSQGSAKVTHVLKCVQIASGKREDYRGDIATEDIYAGSRVEIGRGAVGTGDGSVGAWAAQYVTKYGTLLRKKYGSIDLTKYSGARAKAWGAPRAGVPDELEPIAREHPVQTTSLVQSYEEARDAIANGYPVSICSNQGFTETRDSDGFCRASGSWPHCMAALGVDDAFKRPGLLILNSWGPSWVSGPKRHNQPDGSFWAEAATVDRMLRGGDSFAYSGYVGFPKQDIPDFMHI
jgi:hypothetical protein